MKSKAGQALEELEVQSKGPKGGSMVVRVSAFLNWENEEKKVEQGTDIA